MVYTSTTQTNLCGAVTRWLVSATSHFHVSISWYTFLFILFVGLHRIRTMVGRFSRSSKQVDQYVYDLFSRKGSLGLILLPI